jgi:hypothetical protein
MSFTLNAIFSLSVGLSVVIGWIRFGKTDPAFFPFLVLVTVSLLNEIISLVLAFNRYPNIINFNTFQLIESLLLTWQFLRWDLFGKRKKLYYALQCSFVACWLVESIAWGKEFNSYFIIVHAFIIVIMSIHTLNGVAMRESTSLFKHPVALLCMGLMAYFTYAVLVEAFWIVGFNHQRLFRLKIFEILAYINLMTNLIFAFAFLWMPMKPQYIMRS